MDVIISQTSRLKAQIRLGRAISAFYESLDAKNRAIFNRHRDAAQTDAPGLGDIRQIAAEIDRNARKPCGDRFRRVLESLQQFVAVGDVLIGSTQNMLAAGVWSVARLTITVSMGYARYRDAVSEIFLEIGHSAPRHAELASIYPDARRLRLAMLEYTIVVVELCHSIFQKSSMQHFKTSLKAIFSDPQLRKTKDSLARWSREVSDEIVVLQSQRLEEKRSLIPGISESDRRRKQARARAKWLDACTDYDYERQHRIVRRSGNTSFFVENPCYRNWKAGDGPSVLFCEGKLGAGKSVLMANMIDDLVLDNASKTGIVAYFFVSDDAAGNRARTVLGSLSRQILESLPDAGWTDLLGEESRSLTTGGLVRILAKVVPSTRNIYLVLDGFDEFPEIERRVLVEDLKELQSWVQLRICVSWRLEAKSRAREDFDVFARPAVLEIPRVNPDIDNFVAAELDTLLENGELSIRDSAMLGEIRRRLVEGADGMFLWVTLQLQAICFEDEDTIHEALDNLPRSLPEIFHRILKRTGNPGNRYQMHILKILVAAFRPLTTAEFAEALSLALDSAVTPAQLDRQRVGDIRLILSSCGSLVMIDEQELTVHLVHQSVRQFLLGEMVDTQDYREWHFTADTAHLHMAAISMRYLSIWSARLDVSKTTDGAAPSTTPQPSPVLLPNPAAIQRAAEAEQGKLSKLLSIAYRSKMNTVAAHINVGRTVHSLYPGILTTASTERPSDTSRMPTMDFLAYAREFWMPHSAPMTEDDGPLYLLWSQVLTTSETKDWLTWDTPYAACDRVDVPETMLWAAAHSHNILLDRVLRKQKQRLRLLNDCLAALLQMSPMPCLSPVMAARFLTLNLFLERGSASKTELVLGMRPDFSFNNYACLYAAVFARDYHTTRAILHAIGDAVVLNTLPYPLIELSVSCMDVHMTHLLLFHGVRPLPSSHAPQRSAIALAMSRLRPGCDPSGILIASWLLKSWAGTDPCSPHHLAGGLIAFREMTNERDFKPEQCITVPIRGWLVYYALLSAGKLKYCARLSAGKLASWLGVLFTLKGLAVYATAIAFLDVTAEFRAMLCLVSLGGLVFCLGFSHYFLSRPKKAPEAPRAFPPVVRRVAAVRAFRLRPDSTHVDQAKTTKRSWKLRGTTSWNVRWKEGTGV